MATSGNWDFNLDIGDVIDEAYERVGVEARTGYQYRTARRSLGMLLLEWQNRGLNLWTVKSASQALTSGTASYTLSAEKLDVVEVLLRTDSGDTAKQVDLHLKRVSISDYARQTNKLTTGRPTQYWVERSPDAITLHLWPVPDGSQTYTLYFYYMEQLEDPGKPASNTLDIPSRHLPALTAGLAYYLALKTPKAMAMIPTLKQVYDEQFEMAADSAREKASLFIKPMAYRV